MARVLSSVHAISMTCSVCWTSHPWPVEGAQSQKVGQ